MSLTQDQIKHIAQLSRLKLSDEDVIRYAKDLNSIVGYIDALNKLPEGELQGIVPTPRAALVPRIDEESRSTSPDALLECSSKKKINHQIAIENIMQ